MSNSSLGAQFLKELESEAAASRHCLERIPENLFTWKPHEKSMTMGYLALLVAEIPKWITHMVEESEINFSTFTHFEPKTTAELVQHFDENMEGVRKALTAADDEALAKTFFLKHGEQVLFSAPVGEYIGPTINHLVHHRGQLSVYMRLSDIPVPSIYGPSADERTF